MNDLQKVFNAAVRGNTSIYTLDPRGIGATEDSAADVVSLSADKQILNETISLLRTIAEQTDGRAIVNRNDPMPALQQMVRDSSAYYLLGYTSSSAFRDGKFHEIQVRVRRSNIDVRARKGYWAISAEEITRATAAAKPPVAANVTEALDELASVAASGRRQPVTLWLGATRGPAEKALVTLVWEAGASETGSQTERVDHLTVSAYSIYGDTLFTGRVDRDPQSTAPAGRTTFEAPAGLVTVKVEAANASGRRLESREASVEVPDFSSTTTKITDAVRLPWPHGARPAADPGGRVAPADDGAFVPADRAAAPAVRGPRSGGHRARADDEGAQPARRQHRHLPAPSADNRQYVRIRVRAERVPAGGLPDRDCSDRWRRGREEARRHPRGRAVMAGPLGT